MAISTYGVSPPTGHVPRATYRCEEGIARDPLRDRILRVIGDTPTPVSTAALRSVLGIRNQTLLTTLQHLTAEGLLHRTGRQGWIGAATDRSRS